MLFIFTSLIFLTTSFSYAVCSNNEEGAPGQPGEIEYFIGVNSLRYCDGSDWVEMINRHPNSLSPKAAAASMRGDRPDERVFFVTGNPVFSNIGNMQSLASSLGLGASHDGLQAADKICQYRAEQAGLKGHYLAFLAGSNEFSAPAWRFEKSPVSYVSPDGNAMADNWAGLLTGLDNAIDNEYGAYPGSTVYVPTNTTSTGFQYSSTEHCVNFSSNSAAESVSAGHKNLYTGNSWLRNGSILCSTNARIYCVEQRGPKLVWTFDEGSGSTATDQIEGLVLNFLDSPTWVAGIRGSALDFDGSDPGLSDGNADSLVQLGSTSPINDQFTISFWVNVDSFPAASRSWFLGQDDGTVGGSSWRIDVDSSNMRFGIRDSGGTQVFHSTTFTPSFGDWYHITWTRNIIGDLKVYINGELYQVFTGTSVPNQIDKDIKVGQAYTSYRLDGRMDDIRVYNYPLSREQIQEIFSGPIIHLKLDEVSGTSAKDSSLFGNNATYSGGLTGANSVEGVIGTAIEFTTGSHVINFSNSPHLNVDDSDFTVSFWMQTTHIGVGNKNILIKGTTGTGGIRYLISWTDSDCPDRLKVEIDDNVIKQSICSPNSVADGQWRHIVMHKTDTALSLYINGIFESSVPLSSYGSIANSQSATLNILSGALDEFKMWKRALSAHEITDLFLEGSESASLIGHWKLDETGVTTVAVDSSTQGNNGTLNSLSGANTTPGPFYSGLSFSGSSTSISVADSSTLDLSDDFSFGGWYRFTGSSSDGGMRLLSRQDGSNWLFLQYDPATDRWRVGLHRGSLVNLYSPPGEPVASDQLWHHIMVVRERDGSTLRLYIDGRESSSLTGATGSVNPAGSLIIGAIGTGERWIGDIDDIRLYNRALSALEVRTLYASRDGLIPCSTAGMSNFNRFANTFQWCDGTYLHAAGLIASTNPILGCNSQPFTGSGGSTIINGALGFSERSPNEEVLFHCQGGSAVPVGKTCTECGGALDTKVIFAVESSSNGNIGGVNGADLICQNQAKLFGLSGIFKAWLATSSSDQPATRFSTDVRLGDISFKLTDGTLVANNWSDLIDGTLNADIDIAAYGFKSNGNVQIATNVNTDGTVKSTIAADHCSNFTSTTGSVSYGQTNRSDSAWTDQGGTVSCSTTLKYYCFEQ